MPVQWAHGARGIKELPAGRVRFQNFCPTSVTAHGVLTTTEPIEGQRCIDPESSTGVLRFKGSPGVGPGESRPPDLADVSKYWHHSVLRHQRKRSEPTRSLEMETALQFFGGGGRAEVYVIYNVSKVIPLRAPYLG